MKPIKRPSKKTGLFTPSKEPIDWVFAAGLWPPRGRRIALRGLRMTYKVISSKNEQVILITPDAGHEAAIWDICMRLLQHVDAEEARQYFSK